MKRILTLSLLAAACSAAFAQTSTGSLTVYGIVDAGVQRVSGYNGGAVTSLVSGIMEGSRLGVRGNEDLGGGYRAVFTLENRTELDTGALSNRAISGTQLPDRVSQAALLGLPSALQPVVTSVAGSIGSTIGVNLPGNYWDRQIFVGLVTPVGALLAGRQYTPAYIVSATFDPLGTQSSLSAGQVASIPTSIDIRLSNTLQYRVEAGGVSAALMMAFGETAGNNKASRFIGGSAIYKNNAFSVGLGYNKRNNEVGDTSLESTVLGASVNVGPGKVTGLYAKIKDDHPTGLSTLTATLTPAVGAATAGVVQNAFINAFKQDGDLMSIGYVATLGPNTVYVAYNSFNDKRPNNADTTSYGAAYSYALSKRTDLNVVLTHFNNKGLGQAAPGQAGFLGGVTKSAGVDSNSFAFGIRHRF